MVAAETSVVSIKGMRGELRVKEDISLNGWVVISQLNVVAVAKGKD